jgi:predicted nucleic acid-binding protein
VTGSVVVSDSSPLIILWQIGRLELLSQVFDRVVVPPAVEREVAPSLRGLPSWVDLLTAPPLLEVDLGPGEREAIALAPATAANYLIVDDLPARRLATQLGLRITGSAGLLVRARRLGLIDAVRPDLDAIIASGLYLSRRVYLDVLASVGKTAF